MTARTVVIDKGRPGPRGPAGPPGPTGPGAQTLEQVFATPAATWTVTHAFTRDPVVTVLCPTGPGGALEEWETDVTLTAGQVVVTFASPQTGKVVLS